MLTINRMTFWLKFLQHFEIFFCVNFSLILNNHAKVCNTIEPTQTADTVKLPGPWTFTDKTWIGPLKLRCINMINVYKIKPKSIFRQEQGKSEGFESCDRPIVRKRPIWVKISDVLSRVTLKFDGWPWKTIGHLSFAVSSFVQHFIAIGEFKLELLSGNAPFGSNLTIFRAVWPWNLTYDLEKQ